MKIPFLIICTCFTAFVFAQNSADPWNGTFAGNLVGVKSTLSGHCTGTNWTGTVDAGGYIFNLEGSFENASVNGTMSDAQSGISVPFRAGLTGDKLTIYINDINPSTGLQENMELVFTRTDDKSSGNTAAVSTPKGPVDSRLIGKWRYTDSYVSGQFSFATDYFMQFKSDGTMMWTDGRTAGGGPDISMDSGSGDVHSALWKTENKVIWLDAGNGWEYYAKYYEENGNMMLTFNNGNKQVWSKIFD